MGDGSQVWIHYPAMVFTSLHLLLPRSSCGSHLDLFGLYSFTEGNNDSISEEFQHVWNILLSSYHWGNMELVSQSCPFSSCPHSVIEGDGTQRPLAARLLYLDSSLRSRWVNKGWMELIQESFQRFNLFRGGISPALRGSGRNTEWTVHFGSVSITRLIFGKKNLSRREALIMRLWGPLARANMLLNISFFLLQLNPSFFLANINPPIIKGL